MADGQHVDWEYYDEPQSGPPTSGAGSSWEYGSSYGGSGVSRETVPGPYLPPWRRNGSQDGINMGDDAFARVNSRGNAKLLGAAPAAVGAFRKIQRVPYALTKKNFDYLAERFPFTAFQVYKDHGHDHPVAHLETMVASRHVMDTIKDGTDVLDVYGNPQSIRSWRQRANTRGITMEGLCHIHTERDALRSVTKWGNETEPNGDIVYRSGTIAGLLLRGNELERTARFKHFLFFHSLYYLDFEELSALLTVAEGSTFSAVIHRHKEDSGVLFGGEVKYNKQHGIVVQTNVQTGERYVHRDLEWMFQSRSKVWRGSESAFTWTFKKVTDETWIIQGAACPVNLDERFEALARQKGPEAAAAEMNAQDLLPANLEEDRIPEIAGCDVHSIGGVVLATPNDTGIPIAISNFEFYEYLAASMVGKPRDEERLKDLYSLARRENATTSTFPGAKKFSVPHHKIADHVHLAFHTGVSRETMLCSAFASSRSVRRKLDSLANGNTVDLSAPGGVVSTALRAARVTNNAMRQKDTFGAILDGIESAR